MDAILQAKGVQINQPDGEGQTPIFYAVVNKSLEMLQYLEKHGANLEHREMLLRTPLYFAASCGCTDIIRYLVDKGCDVNICSNLGRTALAKACWNGEPEVVKLLLNNKSIMHLSRFWKEYNINRNIFLYKNISKIFIRY